MTWLDCSADRGQLHETVIVDESLCSLDDAHRLAAARACNGFNIRVSKCGGLLHSFQVARVARDHGLVCMVGAQVGESGILSAAGRHLAAAIPDVMFVEGSAGRLLLKEDLTMENVLPGQGRLGSHVPRSGPGCARPTRTVRPTRQSPHHARCARRPRGCRAMNTPSIQELLAWHLRLSAADRFDTATRQPMRAQSEKLLGDRSAQRQHRVRSSPWVCVRALRARLSTQRASHRL